ncbi:MAG: ACT domain-containing protein [Peptococcaceae bacterium]|nr:ACT domain-containing protein [Peptococcaceae bacterium]
MTRKNKDFLIVSKTILSKAILKTAAAKEMIAKGEAETVHEAVERAGLSRSAFYKYKDGVFPFYDASKEKIVTLSLILENKSGVLSTVLNSVAACNGNVLTINQGLPLQGVANVSVSIETAGMVDKPENLITKLNEIPGVHKIELIGQS